MHRPTASAAPIAFLALLALWRMNALTVREPNEIAN